jgi:two-component system nitrogen regulation response regulator GlnG
LFHRLNVIRLRLPALRERHEDVPVLTRHFLQQSARQLGVEPKRIADSAIARLEQFAFPGNVRQLENICHWLTVMAPAQVISLQDLPPEVLEAPLYQPAPRPGSDPSAAVAAVHAVAAPMPTPAPAVELVGGLPQPATVATQPLVGGIAASATPALGATPHWPAEAQMATGSGGIAATVGTAATWEQALETEAQKLLAGGQPEVWDALTRRFESRLIRTALTATHGRRMEAAQRLGIGRNTITRKIQELGLDAPDEA